MRQEEDPRLMCVIYRARGRTSNAPPRLGHSFRLMNSQLQARAKSAEACKCREIQRRERCSHNNVARQEEIALYHKASRRNYCCDRVANLIEINTICIYYCVYVSMVTMHIAGKNNLVRYLDETRYFWQVKKGMAFLDHRIFFSCVLIKFLQDICANHEKWSRLTTI